MVSPDDKTTSHGISRDMSSEAISRRLRIVSDLRILCLKLGQAKRTKPEAAGSNQPCPPGPEICVPD